MAQGRGHDHRFQETERIEGQVPMDLLPLMIQSFQMDPEIARQTLEGATITIEGEPYLGDPHSIPNALVANRSVEIHGVDRGLRLQIVG